jgi:rhodanese-related sulfurtransferase
LIDAGALLVDIRNADEHARERIPGAVSRPLASLTPGSVRHAGGVLFHCRSGARTLANRDVLAAAADGPASLVEGGLDGWKAAGLPAQIDRGRPIDVMRQVQIAAGSLVVIGALMGVFVDPRFHWLSAFVGAGLVFAGASGVCTMANILRHAPWNRLDAQAMARAR